MKDYKIRVEELESPEDLEAGGEPKPEPADQESGFYDSYAKFSNLLRTWLVAFGIGALFFLASQDIVVSALQENEDAGCIVNLLVFGVGLQAFGAFLYKYTMGVLYHGELHPEQQKGPRYKFFDFVSESFAIEAIIDVVTVVAYLRATYLLTSVVVT